MSDNHYFFDGQDDFEIQQEYATVNPLQSCAMMSGQSNAAVKKLIGDGYEFSNENFSGNSCLHIASWANRFNFLKQVPEDELLEGMNKKNHAGRTPVMVAVKEMSRATVDFWIEKGADLSIRDNDGMDAIDLAQSTGQDDLYNYLLDLEDKCSMK